MLLLDSDTTNVYMGTLETKGTDQRLWARVKMNPGLTLLLLVQQHDAYQMKPANDTRISLTKVHWPDVIAGMCPWLKSAWRKFRLFNTDHIIEKSRGPGSKKYADEQWFLKSACAYVSVTTEPEAMKESKFKGRWNIFSPQWLMGPASISTKELN